MERRTIGAAAALLLGLAACSDATTGGGGGGDIDGGGPDASTEDVSADEAADPGLDGVSDPGLADFSDGEAGDEAGAPEIPEPGFVYECEPLTREACVTSCGSAGQRKCLKSWGPCVPPDEFCGNCVDDDCDGLINEGCPPSPECDPTVEPECPVAVIEVVEGTTVDVDVVLHLSAKKSTSAGGDIAQWSWSVQAPPGAAGQFEPSATVETPTFRADVAGTYLFVLDIWDEAGTPGCSPAQLAVQATQLPPLDPEAGCADGEREGFVDMDEYGHVAGCSGAWSEPGVTPDTVVPTCGRQGGDDGEKADGAGCSSADLCAEGWHVCAGWQELAAKSPTGCAGATPPGAAPKSLFFALRQPSENDTVCGEWGDGFNDVFGCGNLGHTIAPDKGCGPLDRALASTQPGTCGFHEAEPSLGPWECKGDEDSHLNEGALVTKKGCPDQSCSYDGAALSSADKGGVICCRD